MRTGLWVLPLFAALLACKSGGSDEGKFTGNATLGGEASASFSSIVVDVRASTITFPSGTPLAACPLELRGAVTEPSRPVASKSEAKSCMLTVDGKTLEATVSGSAAFAGKLLTLTLNIADIQPSTGNTGFRSWTMSFTGTK